MEKTSPLFKKYVLVCENRRESGAACGCAGERIRELLKEEVKRRGLQSSIRVSRTGCLDVCSEGPNVLVVPDYTWYKKVQESDIGVLLKEITESATKV